MIDSKLELNITFKSLMKFTLPSMAMMLVMSLYTVVDGTFVSRLIGTNAFSAINIVYPLVGITVGLGTMFGSGLSAIISKKLGEGNHKEANENFSFIFAVILVIGVILSSLSLYFLEDIIYLLGANIEIYQYCYDYIFPLLFFFTVNIIQIMFQCIYVVDGKPMTGLIITIIGGSVNAILDYIFIAKLNLGIAGAAYATGIGYLVTTLYGVYYFTRRNKTGIYLVKPKISWNVLIHTMTNGSSEMISNISASVTTFLFNIIMMKYIGQDGVAAISILLYIDFILIAISLGYSMGVGPLISYNYGTQNRVRLKKIYHISAGLSIGVGIFMTFATLFFAQDLAAIFANSDSAVYLLTIVGLQVYSFGYLFKCYNVFASAMFTAFGNGRVSAILSSARTLVLLVVSLFVLAYLFGINGVWMSSVVAELLTIIMSFYYVSKYYKEYYN